MLLGYTLLCGMSNTPLVYKPDVQPNPSLQACCALIATVAIY